ncbi:hypothetical protein F4808DRAFT_12208 [Astrocystis sublimbata]|nr:hypothetical protein F4808DRAFT_12208 [Astrocystis sublimbata]
MLDYLYTGKYEDKPPGCSNDVNKKPTAYTVNSHGESSRNEPTIRRAVNVPKLDTVGTSPGQSNKPRKTEKEKSPSDENDIAETWLYHGRVIMIADYFCLPKLSQMAVSMLDSLVQKTWSVDAYCALLDDTRGRHTVKDLHAMLAKQAANHIGELTKRGLFTGNDPRSDEIAPAVLKICAQNLDAKDEVLAIVASDFVGSKVPLWYCSNCGTKKRVRVVHCEEDGYQLRCNGRGCDRVAPASECSSIKGVYVCLE